MRCGNDACGCGHIEFGGCQIVEEEKRFGALNDEVVDAHGDEVDADRIVEARLDGDLEFGSNAVVAGNKDGILKAGTLQVEKGRRSRLDHCQRQAARFDGLLA